jgi:HK97 family phage prohead protease
MAMATMPPKTDGREARAIDSAMELRFASDERTGPGTATGYAARFNTWADIGGAWRERFVPGAFTRTLAHDDILAVHSHDKGRVVGRTGAGTLTLRQDDSGLAFENPLPDTTDGRDLSVSIDRGDIPGMSFAFIARRQEWNEMVEPPERTIFEADLIEITYSAKPAYSDTSVGLRSLDEARKERRSQNFDAAARRVARKMTVDLRSRGVTSKA